MKTRKVEQVFSSGGYQWEVVGPKERVNIEK
jgi:hypothetical protein